MSKIKWEKVPESLIWNRVKSLRKEKGLNQTQVAVGAGIAVNTLYMIEQGYDGRTTEETKKKIAKFFRCDVDDIFPSQMKGNSPIKMPEGKKVVKMQFFVSDEKK